jgi:hypothetical protein
MLDVIPVVLVTNKAQPLVYGFLLLDAENLGVIHEIPRHELPSLPERHRIGRKTGCNQNCPGGWDIALFL